MPRHRTVGKLPEKLVLSDPRALAALAHPARTKIIDELYQGSPRTATQLATVTGLSPSATSYHLRALAKWGLVRRAHQRADERERPWERTTTSISWAVEPGSAAVSDAITAQYVQRLNDDLQAWAEVRDDEEPEWRDATTISRGFPLLTAREIDEIASVVVETIAHIAGDRDEGTAPADARRVAYFWSMVPLAASRRHVDKDGVRRTSRVQRDDW